MKKDLLEIATDHQQYHITINNSIISVDKNMIETVQWFNSFKGIKTIFSCQGNVKNHKEPAHDAYISFICKSKKSLNNIINIIEHWSGKNIIWSRNLYDDKKLKVYIHPSFEKNGYVIRWYSSFYFNKFRKFLITKYQEKYK
jgi:hypothetical protein